MRIAPTLLYGVITCGALLSCSPAAPYAPAPLAASNRPDRSVRPSISESLDPSLRGAPAPTEAPPTPDIASLSFTLNSTAAEPPAPTPAEPESACNPQAPQAFLIRTSYIDRPVSSPEETARRKKLHQDAIEYRTRRYGYVRGFGSPTWNRHEPAHYTADTTFFGIKVRMNERVIPALQCVEEEIRSSCSAYPYEPRILDGLRFRNTFHDGEITNHAFGIAIDIDPDRNSCCGCVPPLNTWPRCLKPVASPFERARVPKCWVDAFTKYGFYWLGYDPLEDTMHFEFLGDPDAILKSSTSP